MSMQQQKTFRCARCNFGVAIEPPFCPACRTAMRAADGARQSGLFKIAPEPMKDDRELDFEIVGDDRLYLERCVQRAVGGDNGLAIPVDPTMLAMDLIVAHNHCGGLSFFQLLLCDHADFCEEIAGIIMNIDRRGGRFNNGFKPKFTKGLPCK